MRFFVCRIRPLVLDLLVRPIKIDLELKTTEFEQSSTYCNFVFSVLIETSGHQTTRILTVPTLTCSTGL